MGRPSFSLAVVATVVALMGLAIADTTCNPLNVTSACPPTPGLTSSSYFMDFTEQTTTPPDWILADYATVGYASPNGANFTFAKRFDAPYIWTRFYVLFGRIEVVMKVAPGAGIISGAVMMSDDQDEIDWEWSGNNFATPSGQVQTNYFGKGQAGWYDRSTSQAVNDPQNQFHTYALDWQPNRLIWSIDGVPVRMLNNNGATTGSYQYPQTPSRLHLGLWCGGDPSTSPGTVNWSGGLTNFSAAPFSAYVKSVKITTNNTCSSWQYPYPFDGSYKSVQCTNQTIALPCTYTVAAGDDGFKIAKKLTFNFDTLQVANQGVDWDKLLLGQVLQVPGGSCPASPITASTLSTTSAATSATLSPSTTTSPLTSSEFSTASNPPTTSTLTTPSTTPSTSPTSSVITPSTTLSTLPTRNSGSVSASSNSSSMLSTTTTTSNFISSLSTTSSTTTSSPTASSNSSSIATTSTGTTPTSTTIMSSSSNTTLSSTTTTSIPVQPYTVVAGDFAWAIADKNGCTFDALNVANPGIDWDHLQIGQTVNIPGQNPDLSTSSSPPVSSATGSTSTPTVSSAPSTTTSVNTTDSSGASTARTSTMISTTVLTSNSTSPSSNTSGTTTASSNGNTGTSSLASLSSTSTGTTSASFSSDGASTTSVSGTPSTAIAGTSCTTPAIGLSSTSSTTSSTTSNSAGTSTPTPTSGSVTSTIGSASSTATPTVTMGGSSSNPGAVNPVTTSVKMYCNQDNCLRNVIDARYSSSMRGFCSTYTTTASNTMALPTFLGGCSADVKRVSSACSCLITSFGTGTATASSSAATTAPAFRSGAPSRRQIPSWLLKRSPLRWNRPAVQD